MPRPETEMSHGPVTIAAYETEVEAVLASDRLEEAGIAAAIQTDTFSPFIIRPTWRLVVDASTAAAAHECLAAVGESAGGDDGEE